MARAQALPLHALYEQVERAAAETELAEETFPAACPYTLDELLSAEPLAD